MIRKIAIPTEIVTRFMDLTVSLFCLPLAMGIISVLYVLHRIFNRGCGGFIYKGERFGKNKTIFTIYKIRTLRMGAEQQIASDVLRPGEDLELYFGKFLRKTRLDELPQLFNVIYGDLTLIGPRPVRPAIYQKYLKVIPNYDIRFTVKPGLIGYSQLLTPHSAPKRVRAMLNNYYIKNRKSPLNDLSLLFFAMVHILKNLYKESILTIKDNFYRYKSRGLAVERRKSRRVQNRNVHFFLADESFENHSRNGFKIQDINHEAIVVTTDYNLSLERSLQFLLKTDDPRSNKVKQAKCRVSRLIKKANSSSNATDGKWKYILHYQSLTDINHYLVCKYVLKEGIL